MKKVISVFLSLVLVICSFGISNISFAEETYGDFEYSVLAYDSSIVITRYNGTEANVIIPEKINGKKVTSLGDGVFVDCENIKSIKIPNSVTSIGKFTFARCYNLESVEIPNSVTSIKNNTFEHCESLKNIKIPNGVTSIGDYAFYGCSNLTNIEIPDSVTSIGHDAFWLCTKLESVILSESIKTMGEYAFYECSNLKSVKIPKNLTHIGRSTFRNCSNLENVIISDGVKTIGDNAFYECSNLKSVNIPNSITSMGRSTFYKCTNLKDIKISNSVKIIESSLFNGCKSIESIKVPSGVISIEDMAFYGCSNLTSIDIPNSVKDIKQNAFNGCYSLIIYGSSDSYAEQYAKENNFKFINNTISLASSNIKVNSIDNQIYTGLKIEPNVVIKYNDNVLIKNVDYKLSYAKNTSVGSATVKITGIGEYTGTKTVTFKIVPKTVTGVKEVQQTTSKIKLTWDKASKASGYYIYRSKSKDGNYKKIATVTGYSKNYYTDYKNLSSGEVYYYKIRSYKKINSKYYYGYYSDVYTASTKCSKPSIVVTSPKTKNIKVSWKKINGADGYAVYRATSKNGTYLLNETVISGSTLSYTNTGLIKGKTYYYKVKAYKIVNGKKIYSDYSSVKYKKCK